MKDDLISYLFIIKYRHHRIIRRWCLSCGSPVPFSQTGKRNWLSLSGKKKGDQHYCYDHRGMTLLSVPDEVLTQVLLMLIKSHLLKFRRPEQAGFRTGKSKTDGIIALRFLVEYRLEFQMAFDSVHLKSLRDVLQVLEILANIIDLMIGLYYGTENAVQCGNVVLIFPC